jgi:hypothetical protein
LQNNFQPYENKLKTAWQKPYNSLFFIAKFQTSLKTSIKKGIESGEHLYGFVNTLVLISKDTNLTIHQTNIAISIKNL